MKFTAVSPTVTDPELEPEVLDVGVYINACLMSDRYQAYYNQIILDMPADTPIKIVQHALAVLEPYYVRVGWKRVFMYSDLVDITDRTHCWIKLIR